MTVCCSISYWVSIWRLFPLTIFRSIVILIVGCIISDKPGSNTHAVQRLSQHYVSLQNRVHLPIQHNAAISASTMVRDLYVSKDESSRYHPYTQPKWFLILCRQSI